MQKYLQKPVLMTSQWDFEEVEIGCEVYYSETLIRGFLAHPSVSK